MLYRSWVRAQNKLNSARDGEQGKKNEQSEFTKKNSSFSYSPSRSSLSVLRTLFSSLVYLFSKLGPGVFAHSSLPSGSYLLLLSSCVFFQVMKPVMGSSESLELERIVTISSLPRGRTDADVGIAIPITAPSLLFAAYRYFAP